MKKSLLFLCTLFVLTASAQEVDENFDSYTAGDFVGTYSPSLDTWSGTDGGADDVLITDSLSNSAPNSMELISTDVTLGGPGDIVMPLGYADLGYVVSFYIYVEAESGAYYNIQTDTAPGIGWAYDVFFDAEGGITYSVEQIDQGVGSYTNSAWVLVENTIDLVNNQATISIDGEEQITLPFNSVLGGVNFYALGDGVSLGHYYIDDIEVNMYEPVSVSEVVLNPAIYPNPAKDVINVSDIPVGSAITLKDLLGREVCSTTANALITEISCAEWERGYYFITVSNDLGEITRKVVVE